MTTQNKPQGITDVSYSLHHGLAAIPGREDAPILIGGKREAGLERKAAMDLHELEVRDAVMRLWLDGMTLLEISQAVDEGMVTVHKIINEERAMLREQQDVDITHLAAERVEGFRRIKGKALGYLSIQPRQAAQLLAIAVRCEEQIAKIQGVLSDKVVHLGRIEHIERKLYDFEDGLPAAHKPYIQQEYIIEDTGDNS